MNVQCPYCKENGEDRTGENPNEVYICSVCDGAGTIPEEILLKQIEAHILKVGKCSLSDIQRTFNLNYPKARKYIDKIKEDNCSISNGSTNDNLHEEKIKMCLKDQRKALNKTREQMNEFYKKQ